MSTLVVGFSLFFLHPDLTCWSGDRFAAVEHCLDKLFSTFLACDHLKRTLRAIHHRLYVSTNSEQLAKESFWPRRKNEKGIMVST